MKRKELEGRRFSLFTEFFEERAENEDGVTPGGVWHPGVFAARVRKVLRTGGLSFLAEPRVRKSMKTLGSDFLRGGGG